MKHAAEKPPASFICNTSISSIPSITITTQLRNSHSWIFPTDNVQNISKVKLCGSLPQNYQAFLVSPFVTFSVGSWKPPLLAPSNFRRLAASLGLSYRRYEMLILKDNKKQTEAKIAKLKTEKSPPHTNYKTPLDGI